MLVPAAAGAQQPHRGSPAGDTASRAPHGSWTRWTLGVVTSLAAHEAGHIAASYAVGAHPHFGLDKGRPTVYSGVDPEIDPHKQLVFSSAGLAVQAALDEMVLDVPHARGTSFGRGMLASGIGTALFYMTLGRNGIVSDVALISRTSGLSKGEVSLILGAVHGVHAFRFVHDPGGPVFFACPAADGRLRVGIGLDGPLERFGR
jgi:hypothetical protein